ncbi:hypothetical protein [Pararhizobium haloflavum]|uniref:hypothetical protein n=1 Tax=Pararhizobium haloflavum TaxID=2037914 RepID=UPI0012FFF351|nr:hypothetical protein [Pararhizobium haloflavum]
MRHRTMLAALILTGGLAVPALAQDEGADAGAETETDCGPQGTPDAISAQSWSIDLFDADSTEGAGFDLTIELQNELDAGLSEIEARYFIRDADGGLVTSFQVEPEAMPGAGETFETFNSFRDTAASEINDPESDIATILVCTSQVVYEDGSEETF